MDDSQKEIERLKQFNQKLQNELVQMKQTQVSDKSVQENME